MNFFEHQERARKKTTLLIFFFALAVILIVMAVNIAGYALSFGAGYKHAMRDWHHSDMEGMPSIDYWASGQWIYVTVSTLLVVIVVSVKRTLALADGGSAVAEMAGARLVNPATPVHDEKKLINVVEEMSVASGVPVPSVYVMDNESGINAFAAGWSADNAALVFSAGAMKALNRDELQGVAAHEFSHIFNGDMRMNIRLMGVLAGILAIGQLGAYMAEHATFGTRRSAGALIVGGLILFAIGYIGLFFGRLIKAAISRERELLADASAVQFTRNPRGIGCALLKIMKSTDGSKLGGKYAEDLSHLCFSASGTDYVFEQLLATHPPTELRIKAIDPSILNESPKYDTQPDAAAQMPEPKKPWWQTPTTPAQFSAMVGSPTNAHMEFATMLLAAIPPDVKAATKAALGAKAVVYSLLLADDLPLFKSGLDIIMKREGADISMMTGQFKKGIDKVGPIARLPLVDLSLPAIKSLSDKERTSFLETVELLINLDGETSLFEYALHCIMKRALDTSYIEESRNNWVQTSSITPLKDEAAALMLSLAKAGAKKGMWEGAYEKAMTRLGLAGMPAPTEDISIARLNLILEKLSGLTAPVKQALIEACADCVLFDGEILPSEAELLRAVSVNVGCPMPPLVATYLSTF